MKIHKDLTIEILEKKLEVMQILRDMKYSDYLKTNYWHELKKKVRRKYKGRCATCNSDKRLNTHHRDYENRGQGKYELEDLVLLCSSCHKLFHDHQKKSK